MDSFIDKRNKNKILVKCQNLAYVLFYKLRDTSVLLQIDGEVRQDKQLGDSLMANRNIEDTQHDFTTGKKIMTEPEQSSQKVETFIALKVHPIKTLQLSIYVAYWSFHCRGRFHL
jgi:hypothetical protein